MASNKPGRPPKTLYAHVRDNTYRHDRHGHLLTGPLLPKQPPPRADPDIWAQLRKIQQVHRDAPPGRYPTPSDGFAEPFGKVVRALHGGRRTYWLNVGKYATE